MTKKHPPLPLKPYSVPKCLIECPQWVLWKAEIRDGKPTKVPYRVVGAKRAKVNDASCWSSFRETVEKYAQPKAKWSGIGFVLTGADPYAAIDLDHVSSSDARLDPNKPGDLPAEIQAIIKRINSYTEISPSGTGIRIFMEGSLPPGGRKKGNIEMYDAGRYVTVTGHHLTGTPANVKKRQVEIEALHARVFGVDKKKKKSTSENQSPILLADDELMKKMLASGPGNKIASLLSGDISGYPSQSEADAAICSHLAFWYGRDAGRMDAVFRSSGLFREKWDKRHHADGRTYGQATIDRAIQQCKETYSPAVPSRGDGGGDGKSNSPTDREFLLEYCKITEPDPQEIAKYRATVVRYLNSEGYSAITIDGKFTIVYEYRNPTTGRNDLSYLRKQDFLNKFENRVGITGRSKNGPTYSSWAQVWLRSPNRREFNGIVFDTTGKANPGFFNIFRPYTPPAGPSNCDLYIEHIQNIICRGDKALFDWLIDWMAWIYQNRGNERPGTAVVLRGSQGTGKGTWVLPFGQLFGDHFLHITTSAQFAGRFTEHMKNAILVFLDEAFWAGDKKSEGQLKAFITEPYIMVEGKFINPYVIKNHCNLIFASNSSWIVPAGLEERRFFALNVSSDRQRDYQYFREIKKQMKNGGTADLARYLKDRKITNNLREAPRTDEFLSQVLESMDPEQSFWYQALREEALNDPYNVSEIPIDWPDIISKQGLWDLYRRFCQRINIHSRFLTDAQFGRRMKSIAPITDGPRCCSFDERVEFKERMTTYRIPPLKVARGAFESLLKLSINWENECDVPF